MIGIFLVSMLKREAVVVTTVVVREVVVNARGDAEMTVKTGLVWIDTTLLRNTPS